MADEKREKTAQGNEDERPRGATAVVALADGRPAGGYHLRSGSLRIPPKAPGDDANESDPRGPFRVRVDQARELIAEGICDPVDDAAQAIADELQVEASADPADLTNDELRDELREAGLLVSGKKKDLVARVERLRAGEITDDDRPAQ